MDSDLKPVLGPWMLWGLGVGYVISGMYFGWNLGLPEGGPLGLLAATLVVTLLYVLFCLSYCELSCAIPKAGGAFVYAEAAFGLKLGFLVGISQWVEFVFIGPAVARAIGDYFSAFFPGLPPVGIACAAYGIFTALNIYGVQQSAVFELVVSALAVGELCLFAGVTGSHFHWKSFLAGAPDLSLWAGSLRALPYAIWFYVGIEGLANLAEESHDPARDMPRAFSFCMATLAALALLTFFSAVGVAGWQAIVYRPGTHELSDSPLPLAVRSLLGTQSFFYALLISVGLCGLIASFHGTLLAAGRATLEFGRRGLVPRFLGRTLRFRKTPANALLANLVIGLIAMATGRTSDIIILSVFGALTLMSTSMIALCTLRRQRPELHRPYKTPFYPWTPVAAAGLATFCLATLAYYNRFLFLIYLGILGAGLVWIHWGLRLAIGLERRFGA